MRHRRSSSASAFGARSLFSRRGLIRSVLLVALFLIILQLGLVVLLFDGPSPYVDVDSANILDFPNEVEDKLWIAAMKDGEIVRCDFFKPKESAISEKHIIILSYHGILYKTMAKIVQPKIPSKDVPLVIDAKVAGDHGIYRRADRDFQAFPEIVGYHVDRILGIYRKPPFVSRVVTNKVLYRNTAWFPTWNIGRFIRSISYKLAYYDYEHNIYISLQPWMSGLENAPPSLEIREYLTVGKPDIPFLNPSLLQELKEVSDTLVYDFLVDEHDRKAEKNWVVSSNGTQLLWDNGLAFDHGPFGKSECLDILCASNEWRGAIPKDKPCERICRFSRSIFNTLQHFDEASPQDGESLGTLLQQSLRSDLLAPLFHFAKYEHFKGDHNLVSFKVDNFYEGMDIKVGRMLEHIYSCISRFGQHDVLM